MSSPVEVRRARSLILAAAPPSMLGIVVSDRSPRTVASVAETDRSVLAAIDGPMFSVVRGPGDGSGNAAYRTYKRGRLEYAHIDTGKGIDVQTRHAERGMTISIVDGRAYANRGARIQSGASVAIQTYPSMIWNGVNEGSRDNDTDRNERAAVGILRDGRVFLAVYEGGIREMSQSLMEMGAEFAGYTDGGGSAGMFVRNEPGSQDLTVNFKTRSRRIVSFVTLEQRSPASNAMFRVRSAVNDAARSLGIDVDDGIGDIGAGAVLIGTCVALGVAGIAIAKG